MGSKIQVTILILIDGFLQYNVKAVEKGRKTCHNPYFNRWFSAIPLRDSLGLKTGKSQSLF